MSTRLLPPLGAVTLAGALALAVAACSPSGPGTSQLGSNTVSGKVTHKGAALPYGFVVFYGQEKAQEGEPPQWVSVGASPIGEDGSYEIVTAPEGPVFVCVMTDPDLDVSVILSPSAKVQMGPPMGGGSPMLGGPPMLGGGPPMLGGGPPMLGGGPPMLGGGPPMLGGGPPMLGGGPPMLGGAPPMAGGGPPMAGKFPDDKMPPRLDLPPNPLAAHLTDEQKKLLKELHKRYGQVGGTPLFLEVKAGSQTFDIPLS